MRSGSPRSARSDNDIQCTGIFVDDHVDDRMYVQCRQSDVQISIPIPRSTSKIKRPDVHDVISSYTEGVEERRGGDVKARCERRMMSTSL